MVEDQEFQMILDDLFRKPLLWRSNTVFLHFISFRISYIRGSNIGLAGWGMGLKIEAGCGIQRKLEAGCGIKSSSRDRDKQFFTVGMRDVLKSMAG